MQQLQIDASLANASFFSGGGGGVGSGSGGSSGSGNGGHAFIANKGTPSSKSSSVSFHFD